MNAKSYCTPVYLVHAGKHVLPVSRIDGTASMLLNDKDCRDNIKPIKTTGDGNCLFNAASSAICGNERLAVEIRLRTALELLAHQEFYGAHPAVAGINLTNRSGKKWQLEGLYNAVVFSRASDGDSFQTSLEKEICNTLHNYAWSGLMQIMGLASAIRCEISMIYPDKKHILLPLLNATYRPRIVGIQMPRLTIMWTDMAGWQNRSKPFSVNHFVPMLMVSNAETNEWMTVSNKRRQVTWSMKNDRRKKSGLNDSGKPRKGSCSFQSRPSTPTLKDFWSYKDTNASLTCSTNAGKAKKTSRNTESSPNHSNFLKPSSKWHGHGAINKKQSDRKMSSPIKSQTTSCPTPGTLDNCMTMPFDKSVDLNAVKSSPVSSMPVHTQTASPIMQSSSVIAENSVKINKSSQDSYNFYKNPLLSARFTPMCNIEAAEPSENSPNRLYSASVLPLTGVDRSFYKKRGKLYNNNANRNRQSHSQHQSSSLDTPDAALGLVCRTSNVHGTLPENICSLKQKMSVSHPKL